MPCIMNHYGKAMFFLLLLFFYFKFWCCQSQCVGSISDVSVCGRSIPLFNIVCLCGERVWTVLAVQCGLLGHWEVGYNHTERGTQTLMTVDVFFLSVSTWEYISRSLLRSFIYWSLKCTVADLNPLSLFLDPLICIYLLIRGLSNISKDEL